MIQAVWFGILMLLQLSAQDAGLSSAFSRGESFELDIYVNSAAVYSGTVNGSVARGVIRNEEGMLGRYESSSMFRQVYMVFPSMNLPTSSWNTEQNAPADSSRSSSQGAGPFAHGSLAPLLFDLTPALAGRSLSPEGGAFSIPRGYSVPAELGEETVSPESAEAAESAPGVTPGQIGNRQGSVSTTEAASGSTSGSPDEGESGAMEELPARSGEKTTGNDSSAAEGGEAGDEPNGAEPLWIIRRDGGRISVSNPSLGVVVILNLPR